MTHQHDDERRALEEAALLSEDDPRRREIVDGLEGMGEAHDMWCAIVRENEDLRLRLRDVDTPPGLIERTRGVRHGTAPPRRARPLKRTLTAAIALLVTVVGVLLVRSGGIDPAYGPTYELATLAAMDHAARPKMAVTTDDLNILASSLGDSLPFDLGITAPEPSAVLLGGRLCSFGDRPIVYTRWRTEGGEIAIYQMEQRAFGLRPGIGPVDIETPENGSPDSRCNVRVWTDDRFAYVSVNDRRGPGR